MVRALGSSFLGGAPPGSCGRGCSMVGGAEVCEAVAAWQQRLDHMRVRNAPCNCRQSRRGSLAGTATQPSRLNVGAAAPHLHGWLGKPPAWTNAPAPECKALNPTTSNTHLHGRLGEPPVQQARDAAAGRAAALAQCALGALPAIRQPRQPLHRCRKIGLVGTKVG